MRLVLDTSVALKTSLPEADSAKAIALCEAFVQGIHELLAPDIFPLEAAHTLTKAERNHPVHPVYRRNSDAASASL